jgi:hypothetical protein
MAVFNGDQAISTAEARLYGALLLQKKMRRTGVIER